MHNEDLAKVREVMDFFATLNEADECKAADLKRKYQANRDHVVAWDHAMRSAGIKLNDFVPSKRIEQLSEHQSRYHCIYEYMYRDI